MALRARKGCLLAPAEPLHREGDQQNDQADLEQKPQDGGQPGQATEEAVAHEHAEQARAEEAGHEARAEAEAARLRHVRGGCARTGHVGALVRDLRALDRGRRFRRRAGYRRSGVGARATRPEAAPSADASLGRATGKDQCGRQGNHDPAAARSKFHHRLRFHPSEHNAHKE